MPIEIRELIIKAVVDAAPKSIQTETVEQKRKHEKQLIEESVDQTLKILDKKRER